MRNANDDEQGVRVIFTPRAERHVETLYDYMAERAGEVRAEAYITRIVAFCLSPTTFPLRGNQRDDLLPGLRTIGFERRVAIAFVVTAEAQGGQFGGHRARTLGGGKADTYFQLLGAYGTFFDRQKLENR
jgi:toxin ParE1/3/4